jgi:hypothetical protein
MDTKKSMTTCLAVSFFIFVLATQVWAGNAGLALNADKSHEGADGTLFLSEDGLSIKAKGLRPNGVYTVWFVNMNPEKHEAGAGEAPYMFKTDTKGTGSYKSSLQESPFGKWEMVMIVLHPKRDPTDMKDMVPALSAMVPKSAD